jgi:AcrR family transcriptional regulator
MSHSGSEVPRRGRPPNEKARARVLYCAREILMTEGFGRLTIEKVAAATGVSRPTIYRSWANATELAMAALVGATTAEVPGQHLDLRARLLTQLRSLTTAFATTRGRQVALTLASADPESEYTKAFRNRVILASREAGRQMLEEAVAAGEIVRPADVETLLDMIYGPLFYRLLVGHGSLDLNFADSVVDLAMLALRPREMPA